MVIYTRGRVAPKARTNETNTEDDGAVSSMICTETEEASLLENEVRGDAPLRIPAEVLAAAQPRSSVLGYVAPDPEMSLFRYFFCKAASPTLVLPCFWPILVGCFPCFLGSAKVAEYDVRSRSMLLTQSEVRCLFLCCLLRVVFVMCVEG